jgi:hypothetical protein
MKPWHQTYARRFWTETDWSAWERAGRPKVPKDPILEKQGRPIEPLPVVPQAPTLAVDSLHEKPSTRQERRSRAVDELVAKVRARSRAAGRAGVTPSVRSVRRDKPDNRRTVVEIPGDGQRLVRNLGNVLRVR